MNFVPQLNKFSLGDSLHFIGLTLESRLGLNGARGTSILCLIWFANQRLKFSQKNFKRQTKTQQKQIFVKTGRNSRTRL
jgi:hypothetical protein